MLNPLEHYEFGVSKAFLVDEGERGRLTAISTTPTGYFYPPPNDTTPLPRSQQRIYGYYPASSSFTMKPDGTTIYALHHNGVSEGYNAQDLISQRTLTTPWMLSTMTVDNGVLPAGTIPWDNGGCSAQGLCFSPDGIHCYVTDANQNKLHELVLSTAWNISSATYVRAITPAAGIGGITFNTDGTLMFLTLGVVINRYLLSTAWDISTAVLNGSTLTVNNSVPYFTPDGLTIFTLASNRVYKYYLTVPWDLSSYLTTEFSPLLTGQNLPLLNINTIWLSADGTILMFAAYVGNPMFSIRLTKPFHILARWRNN
jgi:DNA-binding beta-propeller fold protein YncE